MYRRRQRIELTKDNQTLNDASKDILYAHRLRCRLREKGLHSSSSAHQACLPLALLCSRIICIGTCSKTNPKTEGILVYTTLIAQISPSFVGRSSLRTTRLNLSNLCVTERRRHAQLRPLQKPTCPSAAPRLTCKNNDTSTGATKYDDNRPQGCTGTELQVHPRPSPCTMPIVLGSSSSHRRAVMEALGWQVRRRLKLDLAR